MALLTPLALDEARELARAYGVELFTLEPLELGSVNSNFRARSRDGRLLFARLYEEQGAAGATAEVALLAGLARAGVPVPEALPLEGPLPAHRGKPFVVFPWIEGDIRCVRGVRAEDARAVGRALAGVHGASDGVGRLGPGRFRPEDMLGRLERVERENARPSLSPDIGRIRSLYAKLLPRRDTALPSGIVHGDLFRDNVLFAGKGRIAALLDFESAFLGPFVYDLLVTIAAWCFRDAFEIDLARAMVEGYESLRPLEAAERSAIRVEGALGCLRFAVSRITDFELRTSEGGVPGRDYRRFLARLEAIETGLLDAAFAGR
jgi:homoserine kinase type II